ncbi:MAG: M48 family metalloprotease [Bdellovibrionales bacterium]|nr:M48 family metalloprotease [Bdellovibrionales bacterium]
MKSTHRAWLTLATFSLLIIYFGYALAEREGVLWGLVISLSINSIIYLYVESKVLNSFSVDPIEGQDPWGLILSLQDIIQKARIPQPEVLVLKNPSPQVFLLSKSWLNSHIVVTTGLLERLNKKDLKAILAYCVATIKRQDSFAHLVAMAFISTILWVGQIFDKIYRWLVGIKGQGPFFHNYPFTYCLSPFAKIILKFIVKEKDYMEADKLAGSFVGSPKDLAHALWKLQSYSLTLPLNSPVYLAHGFIVNPLTPKGWTRYFQAQPSVKDRIKNLIGYYPV